MLEEKKKRKRVVICILLRIFIYFFDEVGKKEKISNGLDVTDSLVEDNDDDEAKCKSCEKSSRAYLDEANACARQIQQLLVQTKETQAVERSVVVSVDVDIERMQGLIVKSARIFNKPKACENLLAIRLCEVLMDLYVESGRFCEAMRLAVDYLIHSYK